MQSKNITKNVEYFKKNGFFGPIQLYNQEEATDILRNIRIQNQDRNKALYNNNVNYDRHFDIQVLSDHICHPIVTEYLTHILGSDVALWRTEFFPKFPGAKGTEWHQVKDYSYANGKPQIVPTETEWDSFIDITVWTTFTPADRETGCMRFVKKSQNKWYFDEHKNTGSGRGSFDIHNADTGFFGYKFADFLIDPQWTPPEEDVVELVMKPGEAVIFTANCVHGSLPNVSERKTRYAIAARYVATHVRVYPDYNEYTAHGSTFNLSNYGTVIVAGKDKYKHNRTRDTNNHGVKFGSNVGVTVVNKLRKMWEEELKLETVDPDDDFFDLGGHSLSMAHIQTKIKKTTGRAIPMKILFEYPTIKSLSEYMSTQTM